MKDRRGGTDFDRQGHIFCEIKNGCGGLIRENGVNLHGVNERRLWRNGKGFLA